MRMALMLAVATGLLSQPILAHQMSLEGSEWGVAGDQGERARYISFAGSGRVFGFAGCNRFTGTFTQKDHELVISPLATTRMACPPDIMQKERDFLDLLARVRGAHVDHTLLMLLDADGADLRTLIRRDPD